MLSLARLNDVIGETRRTAKTGDGTIRLRLAVKNEVLKAVS